MTLLIVLTPLKKIKIPKQSLKEHPASQVEQIAASIKRFGFNDPVAIDEGGDIIEGVGRVLAAKMLKMTEIPTIVLTNLNDGEKLAYRIAHNKTCLSTGFNLELLSESFESLRDLDTELLVFTAFADVEIDALLKLPEVSELSTELTETLKSDKAVTCPNCGEVFDA